MEPSKELWNLILTWKDRWTDTVVIDMLEDLALELSRHDPEKVVAVAKMIYAKKKEGL